MFVACTCMLTSTVLVIVLSGKDTNVLPDAASMHQGMHVLLW